MNTRQGNIKAKREIWLCNMKIGSPWPNNKEGKNMEVQAWTEENKARIDTELDANITQGNLSNLAYDFDLLFLFLSLTATNFLTYFESTLQPNESHLAGQKMVFKNLKLTYFRYSYRQYVVFTNSLYCKEASYHRNIRTIVANF